MSNTIDSNLTELRFAEEQTIGVLPNTPEWKILEPNSYGDFGAEHVNVVRNPIKPDRQRLKGLLADLEATVNFQSDFIGSQFEDILSAFFFADWRNKKSQSITAVTNTAYSVSDETEYSVGELIYVEDLTTSSNNGFKIITGVSSGEIQVSGLYAESSTGKLTKCGIRTSSGDLDLIVSGNNVNLNSTTLDFTTLGLMAGEWVYIGGDGSSNKFSNSANNGFYKIKTISTNSLVFDQYPENITSETATGLNIDIFYGNVLKNEADQNLIKKKSFQFERKYDETNYEYVSGCVANNLELTVNPGEKIVCELEFAALTAEDKTSAKLGNRPSNSLGSAFNASSDFFKFKLYDENGNNLSSFATELSLSFNNNAVANKAVGYLGGFDISVGDFAVSGSIETYFLTNNAVSAIRNNLAVGISFVLGNFANQNSWLFDIPYMTLGDGKKSVEKDNPIKLPLTMEAAADKTFNYTAKLVNFKYLPQIAFSN